jgi:uncharacterized protein (DUF488 family)
MATVYTIGHSTRTLDDLVAALQGHGVKTLVDIRSLPMSRRLPHFNRESLEEELPKHGISYVWLKELGGRRKKVLKDSPNSVLRNESFRNYADYMMTEEFADGIAKLLAIVSETADPSTARSPDPQKRGSEEDRERSAQDDKSNAGPSARSPEATSLGMTSEKGSRGGTAIMCAERVYFQCHRMLVSDYLTAHGHTVLHIDDEKRPVRQHTLMAEARLVDGRLVYDKGRLL